MARAPWWNEGCTAAKTTFMQSHKHDIQSSNISRGAYCSVPRDTGTTEREIEKNRTKQNAKRTYRLQQARDMAMVFFENPY